MAIKKNELYSSLWASCDKLRGGMDASQYKDYILTLLFVKYVSDKSKGEVYPDIEIPKGGSFEDMIALKGSKNIGEEMDIIIAKLAEKNGLRGVIDNAHFNDETKLGKGDELVDKLTGLISIFQRPEFDFSNNKTSGDDILGDAYEYLMRNFATESGKSKGQFYTPAEVSRILAKVIGIDKITLRLENYTVCDPACGSGSLLIKVADEAPDGVPVAIWGQEKDVTTAGLAKMNFVLHNKASGEVKAANTFSSPLLEEGTNRLKRFDFMVANPPFSLKNWTDGLKDYGRFEGYGPTPPEKNGDFAWLMHILKALKPTGKAAVILPHGVLFRGNAEGALRQYIIDKGYIKGIIGLPANLFYGTSIPACILIIDKSDADERKGIFMIDASHDYIKDGNKNRLRERDIHKIITTYNEQITDDPKYARFVFNDEIKVKNDYNLSIPRYIDSSSAEDLQDIEAHLHGGIPGVDVDSMSKYWDVFDELKDKLFSVKRKGYYALNIGKDDVRNTIYSDDEFLLYANKINFAFLKWEKDVDKSLRNINKKIVVKDYIVWLAEKLIERFADIELLDVFDVFEVLLSYWQEVMSDDVLLLKYDGYKAGKEIENIVEVTEKNGKTKEKIKGWEGKLIPKSVIEKVYFSEERKKIDEAKAVIDEMQNTLDELLENTEEGSMLFDIIEDGKVKLKDVNEQITQIYLNVSSDEIRALEALESAFPLKRAEYIEYIKRNPLCEAAYTDKRMVTKASIKQAIITARQKCEIPEQYHEDFMELNRALKLLTKIDKYSRLVKELNIALDLAEKEKYSELSIAEVKELLVNHKWYNSIFSGISELYSITSHNMANRITELAERYEDTLPELEKETEEYEGKIKSQLERMGFEW